MNNHYHLVVQCSYRSLEAGRIEKSEPVASSVRQQEEMLQQQKQQEQKQQEVENPAPPDKTKTN
jgi:hypothetical protein